jgi:hypothetical protein
MHWRSNISTGVNGGTRLITVAIAPLGAVITVIIRKWNHDRRHQHDGQILRVLRAVAGGTQGGGETAQHGHVSHQVNEEPGQHMERHRAHHRHPLKH